MVRLKLYSKAECELCDIAEQLIKGVLEEPLFEKKAFELVKVDIEADLTLKEQYGWTIPVLAREDITQELEWPFPPSRLRVYLLAE